MVEFSFTEGQVLFIALLVVLAIMFLLFMFRFKSGLLGLLSAMVTFQLILEFKDYTIIVLVLVGLMIFTLFNANDLRKNN